MWEAGQILEHITSHNAWVSEESSAAAIERSLNDDKQQQHHPTAAASHGRVPGAGSSNEGSVQKTGVSMSDLQAAMGEDVDMDQRMLRMRY